MVANTTKEHVVARIQLPEVADVVKWLCADNTPSALYMPLRLSRNGRVVTFALPSGQCGTIVSPLAPADESGNSGRVDRDNSTAALR